VRGLKFKNNLHNDMCTTQARVYRRGGIPLATTPSNSLIVIRLDKVSYGCTTYNMTEIWMMTRQPKLEIPAAIGIRYDKFFSPTPTAVHQPTSPTVNANCQVRRPWQLFPHTLDYSTSQSTIRQRGSSTSPFQYLPESKALPLMSLLDQSVCRRET
jgi:hypothetical protein